MAMYTDIFHDSHEGHRERLRQRLLLEGIDSLKPHEIIEFLLYYALPRQDVNDLAHLLIESFGDVRGVVMAELPELERVPGLGKHAAKWLALVGELLLAAGALRSEDMIPFACFQDLFRCICSMNWEITPPCSVQFCVDAEERLAYRRVICNSLSWGEPDVLREAMADALESEASGVILVLFSGSLPAQADDYDISHARAYAELLHEADCALLDVVIASHAGILSMRQMHMIPEYPPVRRRRALYEDYASSIPDLSTLRMQDYHPDGDNL